MFGSYLIYTVCKELEGKIDDLSTESAWSARIRRIFEESALKGLILNNRIVNVFKKKISLLLSALRKAGQKGGRHVKKLKEKWQKETYSFKIFYNEIEACQLQEENRGLRGQKRKLEASLADEQAKRLKVEEKLEQVLNKAEKDEKKYEKKFKILARKIAKLQRDGKRGPAKKKKFTDYTKQHQSRLRQQMKENCQATLSFLGLYDFIATKVEVFNGETQQYETFSLIDENELPLKDKDSTELTDENLDEINMWIYIKDKFNISNEAWHELAMKTKQMPNSYKLEKKLKELNAKWNLQPTPGQAEGVQLSFKESLEEQVIRLQGKGVLNSNTKIKVKISGDGTNIGKRLKIVNLTYTILNERDIAMSEKGNYILAIIKTTESYDNLKATLADLNDEMQNLKQICVGDYKCDIEYFLGGDWKFLACVCGLGAANQDYACIWCKCPRNERFDCSKKWSLTDRSLGARSCEEITANAKSKKFNCKSVPLFSFIPIDHVIIDTLHLFLRISDNLIELLIQQLRREDAIDKVKTFPSGFTREKYKHMAGYEKFLKDIGISFDWRVNKDSKKLEYRDLTGPEKLLVMQSINFQSLLPNFKETKEMEKLWASFMEIIGDLKLEFTTDDAITQLTNKINSWFDKFLCLYQAKDVTPYMHALYAHVPEFLRLYENISYFTQQGMEKYNDISSKHYFRSSNHRGISALKQILLKKNRIQLLEAAGMERIKKSYKCGNCEGLGHTIKTCSANCKECQTAVCCAHLIKVDGRWTQRCTL